MEERIFSQVNYDLGTLIGNIDVGHIGLPDIQRPFVWLDKKVRDLFDSMYRGYPVGYFLFWENGLVTDSRTIGTDNKQIHPSQLIVDGQQRLTSLYAVIKGVPVVRENYEKEIIRIAFNPLTEKFEVTDAAILRDKSYIHNISSLWQENEGILSVIRKYINQLKETREVTIEEERHIERAITKLSNLTHYPFTVLLLSSKANEEQVSQVFVRINSEGKRLQQADFILTLMSVFWDEGRSQLEDFCRQSRIPATSGLSPFNFIIQPDPDQLLRVCVGLGFKRARLQYVYSILRGKNLDTEEFSEELRDVQFGILKKAQEEVLALKHWHDFLKTILLSGYRSSSMISSNTNLMFAYTLYLIGRTEYNVDEFQLRNVIAKWFFMSSLTSRYTGSPETAMEADLTRFRYIKTGDEFLQILEGIIADKLTEDFWTITLPSDLATSASRSPSLFSYQAALVLLDAQALFSKHSVLDMLDPSTRSSRSSVEKHHIFPKAYLLRQGISDQREINQIANFALLEWNDNMKVSDTSPREYVAELTKRFSHEDLKLMYYWHALPDEWQNMEYQDFLAARRERMAKVIRDGYSKLTLNHIDADTKQISVKDVIENGETEETEFKSTLRVNLHTKLSDSRIELSVLKTLAAFMNTKGGSLVIGVNDDGTPVGLSMDGFKNEDTFHQHLDNLINDKIGPNAHIYMHSHFEDFENERVLVVECLPSRAPMYVKESDIQKFYIRTGNSSSELSGNQEREYITLRFRS